MTLDEARLKSRELWDRMAPGWEKHKDFMWRVTRQVGEWLVDRVAPQPGQTILDIAAGPGDSGFVAARLVGDEGSLISTDFAEEMVTLAKRRAQALDITNAEFRVMDAEHMDLADDSVDGAICRWGFMLMLDPEAALRETRRALRPEGKLAFSVWAGPGQNPWVTLMGMIMTQRGRPPQADPFGPGGMFSLSEHDRIRAIVTAAGFEKVEIEDMTISWEFATFDEFWSFSTELAGAVAALLADLDATEVAEIRDEAWAAAESFRSGDGYAFPGVTVNVLAH